MELNKDANITIDDKEYTLIKNIGEGGGGSVWKAKRENKSYAIKFLNRELPKKGLDTLKPEKQIKFNRFYKEIEFCETHEHDNLIKIMASGEYNRKVCYVMPLYRESLSDFIKSERTNDYLEMAFRYIFQICNGLEYLHDNNVIHRDLKPSNILIDSNEHTLVIADLGIAHFEDSTMTVSEELLANRAYAAPEQKIIGNSKHITKAADIFSLGMIINEILTKMRPDGSDYYLVSDIYPYIDIDKLIRRCLSQLPENRPTIKDVINELKIEYGDYQEKLSHAKEITEDSFPEGLTCGGQLKHSIIQRASKDILIANFLFNNKQEQLGQYNFNYNCDIHYAIGDRLCSLIAEAILYEKCKRKFDYENSVDINDHTYTPLDLNKPDDKKLFESFNNFMCHYHIYNSEILNYFRKCCDYHCREIIDELDGIKISLDDLSNAPILYIVMKIVEYGVTISEETMLIDEIIINWNETINAYTSPDVYTGLKKRADNTREIEILDIFKSKYNISYTVVNDNYVIRFDDIQSFDNFKYFSLNLAKPYYIFEGDVLDLVRVNRDTNGIIELKPWNSFNVTSTLAKIMGLRNDY